MQVVQRVSTGHKPGTLESTSATWNLGSLAECFCWPFDVASAAQRVLCWLNLLQQGACALLDERNAAPSFASVQAW